MNRDPILIRVDGTNETGWERFNRCMTYAAALQRRRRPTYFLSRLEPASLAFAVKRAGHEWLEADAPVGDADDLTEMIQEIRRLRPAAVIVDSLHANEHYLGELVATGALIVSLDHTAGIRFPSHLIINPLLDPGRDAYEFGFETQLLLGRRYAFVRPEIRRTRQVRAQEPPPPFRVLIALGDDDLAGHTLNLTKMMLPHARVERIDVAVRPYLPCVEKLQELAAAHEGRVDIITESHDLMSRLVRCHFAITSGDSWSLEFACLGVPQLLLVHSEAHWPTARRLEDEGAATCLGDPHTLTAAQLRQGIYELLSDSFERQAMARCGRKLIDGRGSDRLVTGLEVLLHAPRGMGFQEAGIAA